MDKAKILIATNTLAKFPKPELFAAKPQPQRSITEEQGQRLLLNQLLVMALESNTRVLVEQSCWPSKADKLVGALHHRITELYDRFFQFNTVEDGDWLNKISGLIDAAAVSVLTIATGNEEQKQLPLRDILTQLATLAGTYRQDDELLDECRCERAQPGEVCPDCNDSGRCELLDEHGVAIDPEQLAEQEVE